VLALLGAITGVVMIFVGKPGWGLLLAVCAVVLGAVGLLCGEFQLRSLPTTAAGLPDCADVVRRRRPLAALETGAPAPDRTENVAEQMHHIASNFTLRS
jgi:hypothetical protein